ncbi:MAG: AmmeMemoRadiSam system radical SAM enzyme [Methanomassiliicoccales archaeon]|nr:AmmeMemoRadiSam system radical SAM enzyme [Methanomassiliicoccales archaeon]
MQDPVARYWSVEGEGVRCLLCPRRCYISEGKSGYCLVRINEGGILRSANYGKVCASVVDPIEKKPIFHYKPGAKLYSLGTFGCNMDCANCQNFSIARSSGVDVEFRSTNSDVIVGEALNKGVDAIAWTFNEPIVWYEFVLDVSKEAKRRGLFSIINTNGFIEREPRNELFKYIQVANIDVKGFTDEFYRTNCHARLSDVLETCIDAKRAGVHVELTFLLIPGMNDRADEIERFSNWVVDELGSETPVHFFRFQPSYKLSHLPAQSIEKLREAYEIAKKCGIKYPYLAGVIGDEHQNTYCHRCGALVVERKSEAVSEKICLKKGELSRFCPTFSPVKIYLHDGKCPSCGESIPIVLADQITNC